MIVDDDTDMLIEQFPRLIQTDPEHGLTYDNLIKLKCHFFFFEDSTQEGSLEREI